VRIRTHMYLPREHNLRDVIRVVVKSLTFAYRILKNISESESRARRYREPRTAAVERDYITRRREKLQAKREDVEQLLKPAEALRERVK